MDLYGKLRHFYYYNIAYLSHIIRPSKRRIGIRILNSSETIKRINEGYSVARFGDGELSLMLSGESIGFQKNSKELAERLQEVLRKPAKKMLLCLPGGLANTEGFTYAAKRFWIWYQYMNSEKLNALLDGGVVYGDALFTRFYIDRRDKELTGRRVDEVRSIWERKKIILIEGENSRLGATNDLFDNADCVKRIIVPSKNAFNVYGKIYKSALACKKEADIFLLSIGPTATVLANDLCSAGVQAIDIGHLDHEYEWYRMGAKKMVPIKNKSVNNITDVAIDDMTDNQAKKYNDSIIERIIRD